MSRLPGAGRVALVTGANRGIGFEVARQLAELEHIVLLGARHLSNGQAAAAQLQRHGFDVLPVPLDIADADMVRSAAAEIERQHGRLDVLVNNAAVDYDTDQNAASADLDRVRRDLENNLFGTWQTTQAMLPLLRRSAHPRVVNVSSGTGALTDMSAGIPAYRISKVSLNALTRMLAAELRRDGVLVNSVCPGWVATSMGGPGGRPVADGAAGVTWAATLLDNGPTGGFFRDRQPIPW
jgi:NAD(P)-dependent dehydrogenase (short-subunit alcohol dehydrogenase family)